METTETKSYHRCYACGKWTEADDMVGAKHCTVACQAVFHRCAVCGKYYESNGNLAEHVCSVECTRSYELINNSYVLHKETI